MTFPALRDLLGLSDDVLSKHLRTLTEAKIVVMTKEASAERGDRRRLTWVDRGQTA